MATSSENPTPVPPQYLTEDASRAIVAQVRHAVDKAAFVCVSVDNSWWSEVRWARNRVSLVGESRTPSIEIRVMTSEDEIGSEADTGEAHTNQTDPVSLTTAAVWAEEQWRGVVHPQSSKVTTYSPSQGTYPKARFWSDATYAMTADERCVIANDLIVGAERAGMLSTGELMIGAETFLTNPLDGRTLYSARTLAECSITVRDPQGTASGWAGASSWAWDRITAQKLADIALEKCLTSRNPVRIEPGRYTLIMEPQATGELMANLFGGRTMDLEDASKHTSTGPQHPFFDHMESAPPVSQWSPPETVSITKIGKQILDPRITLSYEPNDPDTAVPRPFDAATGQFWQPVTWVKDGVLTTLNYKPFLGPPGNRDPKGKGSGGAFRMSGGSTTIDEMIATTKRGLLTTRFSNMRMMDTNSILITGETRDGLWLIENGTIKHAVRNLRFLESPLFVFNQVQQLGVPVPIYNPAITGSTRSRIMYSPVAQQVAPPVKVSDFNFVSSVDAV